MTRIIGTHGILNLHYFERAGRDLAAATSAISSDWGTWFAGGPGRGTASAAAPPELRVAYYADCLDRGVAMGAGADPGRLEPFAQELFVAWVAALRGAETETPLAQTGTVMRRLVRQPAEYLTRRYGQATTWLVGALCAELATYFAGQHETRRRAARDRVATALARHQPRVLLAHSLGSVVAYEALCENPDLPLGLLVTLGSPLGVPNVVFDRLEPAPGAAGMRKRPPGVRSWVNIADRGDPVAIPAVRLGSLFEGVDLDLEVNVHPINPHAVKYYLRCGQLAEVIAPHI